MRQRPRGQRRRKTKSKTAAASIIFYHAKLFELRVNGILVKRLDIRAKCQITILLAFQEENWPPRIDDPLHPNGSDETARLRDIVFNLNSNHLAPGLRFFADGTGQGIRWEFVP